MATVKTINFKKLSAGGVSVYLQDIEGILPAKWFTMTPRLPKIPVPMNYALSIFLDSTIQRMLEKNNFEVIEYQALIDAATEKGLIAEDSSEDPVVLEVSTSKRTPEILFAILQGGNQTKIKELFASADRARAFDIAKEHVEELSTGTVNLIETLLGMAIREE